MKHNEELIYAAKYRNCADCRHVMDYFDGNHCSHPKVIEACVGDDLPPAWRKSRPRVASCREEREPRNRWVQLLFPKNRPYGALWEMKESE